MKKLGELFLITAFLLTIFSGLCNAETITLLEYYNHSNDINDVIHLGDEDLDGSAGVQFVRQEYQGTNIDFYFDISEIPISSNYLVNISHFSSNPNYGFLNDISLNGISLGTLGWSNDGSHFSALNQGFWLNEQFSGLTSDLITQSNVLTISSSTLGGNWDDFEFTNLYISFDSTPDNTNPVPEPATVLLLSTGLLGLAGASRKKLLKK